MLKFNVNLTFLENGMEIMLVIIFQFYMQIQNLSWIMLLAVPNVKMVEDSVFPILVQ